MKAWLGIAVLGSGVGLAGAQGVWAQATPAAPQAAPAAQAAPASQDEAPVGTRGRITARSDVKMAIEGLPGTGPKKLDALAKTLGAPLGTIKRCYGEVVKEHPEVVGTLAVELELPEKGKLAVRAPGATAELKPMKACVDQAFGKLDVSEVPRPAGARVVLELTNSSAAAVGEVRRQEENAAHVEVASEADGGFSSRGRSMEGEVTFQVRARDKETVERMHNVVREALPGMFDCRRRAGKRGSPEGDIHLKLQANGAIDVLGSTVPNERAPICASGVLKRTLEKTRLSAEVTLHFAP